MSRLCARALRTPVGSLTRKYVGALRDPRPAHRSFADPSGEINDLWRKPRENSSLEKIRESVPLLINGSSIMQMQEAL